VLLALLLLRFEETWHQPQSPLHPASLLRNLAAASCATRPFWPGRRCQAAAYGGLFTFLAASAFVLIGRAARVSGPTMALLMFTMSLAYIGGTFLCRRLLRAWGCAARWRSARA
jgi:DHA1 family bicyclomycin/chloramphenicol resistance-like MFS transporter